MAAITGLASGGGGRGSEIAAEAATAISEAEEDQGRCETFPIDECPLIRGTAR